MVTLLAGLYRVLSAWMPGQELWMSPGWWGPGGRAPHRLLGGTIFVTNMPLSTCAIQRQEIPSRAEEATSIPAGPTCAVTNGT